MTEADLARLIAALRAGLIDVRISIEEGHASSSPLVANQLARARSERTERGERVVYVHRDRNEPDGDHSEELAATAAQVEALVVAGARWVGPAFYAPANSNG